jgi:hypothetical protein
MSFHKLAKEKLYLQFREILIDHLLDFDGRGRTGTVIFSVFIIAGLCYWTGNTVVFPVVFDRSLEREIFTLLP